MDCPNYWQLSMLERVEVNRKRCTDEVTCDSCGKHIAWALYNDMEGTYIYCDECKARP